MAANGAIAHNATHNPASGRLIIRRGMKNTASVKLKRVDMIPPNPVEHI